MNIFVKCDVYNETEFVYYVVVENNAGSRWRHKRKFFVESQALALRDKIVKAGKAIDLAGHWVPFN